MIIRFALNLSYMSSTIHKESCEEEVGSFDFSPAQFFGIQQHRRPLPHVKAKHSGQTQNSSQQKYTISFCLSNLGGYFEHIKFYYK